jgi:hypothetical protein
MENTKKAKIDISDLERLLKGARDVLKRLFIYDFDYKDLANLEKVSPILGTFIQSQEIWKHYYNYHHPARFEFLAPNGEMLDQYKNLLDSMSTQPNRDYTYWKRQLEYEMTSAASTTYILQRYIFTSTPDDIRVYKPLDERQYFFVIRLMTIGEPLRFLKLVVDTDMRFIPFNQNINVIKVDELANDWYETDELISIGRFSTDFYNPYFSIKISQNIVDRQFNDTYDNYISANAPIMIKILVIELRTKVLPIENAKLVSSKINCNNCSKPIVSQCCDRGLYCSVDCQVADWKIHKKVHK